MTNNYVCFDRLFRTKCFYVDCKNYLADSLFNKRDLRVLFRGEYRSPEKKYVIVVCSIKKKDKKKFKEAMNELHNKMMLLGWSDYEDFLKEQEEMLKEHAKEALSNE